VQPWLSPNLLQQGWHQSCQAGHRALEPCSEVASQAQAMPALHWCSYSAIMMINSFLVMAYESLIR